MVVIVDLERGSMMNWGKNDGQVVVYIYMIQYHMTLLIHYININKVM